MQIPGTAFPGAKDARAVREARRGATFTTAPLTEPVEWTGQVRAELYVSSTAQDTDFIVRVSDVYPDGRSILLCDYPRRARYRDGFDKEVLLEPGKVYKVAFDVGWISQIFNRGHRIRVTIASTGAPLYEPNPQDGGPLTIDISQRRGEGGEHDPSQSPPRLANDCARRTLVPPAAKSRASSLRLIIGRTAVIAADVPLIHTAPASSRGEPRARFETGRMLPSCSARLNGFLARLRERRLLVLSNLNVAYLADEEIAEEVSTALLRALFQTMQGPC